MLDTTTLIALFLPPLTGAALGYAVRFGVALYGKHRKKGV